MLPACFTWDQLYLEMRKYVEEIRLRVREPRPSTFCLYLTRLCPTIRIRSPRSNVCDVCSVYFSRIKSGATTADTEAFGNHTTEARRMREEYKTDLAFADVNHAVVIMDFNHNLTIPSYNYVYDETVPGKGTDEVNSMLRHFITRVVIPEGHSKLTIYADSCGGQNKNSFVVWMLLALTHMSDLPEIELKFFVKGHPKNAVDRLFGHVRKRISRADVWIMDQLFEVITHASASSALVHIPKENSIFKDYRSVVDEAYKKIKNI
ncbi:hypothetical protein PHMEG_00019864 [Phytophthora megakarya]|uniref:DUF7869 domain-containing protein n=1 Tax=Phytophthora megakarya TaxID=4795 RepID=A0A225VSF1_9STRA|nr:hypothetical protein PHMEG_00019864 [Phytophthora megakarya]